MQVAIPTTGDTLEAPIDSRLGRAHAFLIVDTKTRDFTVITNSNARSAEHGAGLAVAETLAKAGVESVLVFQSGRKALQALSTAGIKVYTGASGSGADVLEQLAAGQLKAVSFAG